MRSSISPIVANRYMEQTEQSDRWTASYPTSFVVNHYYMNIDAEIGEIFIIFYEYTPAEAYSGALCCLVKPLVALSKLKSRRSSSYAMLERFPHPQISP